MRAEKTFFKRRRSVVARRARLAALKWLLPSPAHRGACKKDATAVPLALSLDRERDPGRRGERIRKERARASDAPETIHAVNGGAAEERSGFGVEFQEFDCHFGGADHVVDVEPFAYGVDVAH